MEAEYQLTAEEAENMLNKKSGVQGISGLAPDFREIEAASYGDNERAKIAIKQFTYSIASYIAKYAVAMRGIDAIVFTGGVGENQINIRRGICEKLEFMGVKIDVEANNVRGEEKEISAPDSKVKVYLVPTNEELMNGTNRLDLIVGHGAEFLLTTGNGFSITTTHGARNVLIEEEAKLPVIIPNYGETYEINVDEDVKLTHKIDKKLPVNMKSEVLKRLEKLRAEINDMDNAVRDDMNNGGLKDADVFRINEKIKDLEKQILNVIEG